MFCKNCGIELKDSDKFCRKCGVTVKEGEIDNEPEVRGVNKKISIELIFVIAASIVMLLSILWLPLFEIESGKVDIILSSNSENEGYYSESLEETLNDTMGFIKLLSILMIVLVIITNLLMIINKNETAMYFMGLNILLAITMAIGVVVEVGPSAEEFAQRYVVGTVGTQFHLLYGWITYFITSLITFIYLISLYIKNEKKLENFAVILIAIIMIVFIAIAATKIEEKMKNKNTDEESLLENNSLNKEITGINNIINVYR